MVHTQVAALFSLLAIGCRMPDYWFVGAGARQTESEFVRGLDQSYDGDSYGVHVGAGWDAGERRKLRSEDAQRERALHAARAARGEVEPVAGNSVHIDMSDETRVSAEAESQGQDVEVDVEAEGGDAEASPAIEVSPAIETNVETDVEAGGDGNAGDDGEDEGGAVKKGWDAVQIAIAGSIAAVVAALGTLAVRKLKGGGD